MLGVMKGGWGNDGWKRVGVDEVWVGEGMEEGMGEGWSDGWERNGGWSGRGDGWGSDRSYKVCKGLMNGLNVGEIEDKRGGGWVS